MGIHYLSFYFLGKLKRDNYTIPKLNIQGFLRCFKLAVKLLILGRKTLATKKMSSVSPPQTVREEMKTNMMQLTKHSNVEVQHNA